MSERKENYQEKPERSVQHEAEAPQQEFEPGSGAKGFVGVLFALLALGVVFWVGTRLAAPYPGYETPEKAAADALSSGGGIERKPPGGSSEVSGGSKQMDGQTESAGYETLLASFTNDSDPICGMFLDKSANLVGAKFENGWVGFVSLACFFQYANGKNYEEMEVLNFATWRRNPENREIVPAGSAVYLIEIDGILPGAMAPGVAAFETELEAEAGMGDLGGKVTDFDGMKKYVTAWLTEEGMM